MIVSPNIKDVLKTIPNDVTLVAATKYVDSGEMKKLLSYGVNNFGENRVDSFLTKYNELNGNDIVWHFIGHLQRNKAKLVVNKINYLHSLESLELASLINKLRDTPLKCFIEVSINEEESKDGVFLKDIDNFIEEIKKLPNIELVGLMMMAIKASNEKELEEQFSSLKTLKDRLNIEHNLNLQYLSMGMSEDYQTAIKCGATHVRLGRILFN